MKLLHVTTVPMSLTFLRGQVGYMRARGFGVEVVSSPGPELNAFAAGEGVPVHAVEMARAITPAQDIRAVLRLRRVMRAVRPTVVHAHTPKGGLLGMIAAATAGVPVRIYHMRGLPLMTATGFRRRLLRWTEVVACRLSHRVLCNSESLRRAAIAERICSPDKICVLLGGSGNGVDAAGRFDPDAVGVGARAATRRRYRIPQDAPVIGFVGRIVRDKGIVELVDAWRALRAENSTVHLLLVGPFESQDPVPPTVESALREDPRVHLLGEDWNTPPLYAAMDLLVLPTYREGFPNVPLEAAAMGLPVVATRVPGCVDAVADGTTGMLVPAKDAVGLAQALRNYLQDPDLRRLHGSAGRARALREFRPEAIWEALYEQYQDLLARQSRRAAESAGGRKHSGRIRDGAAHSRQRAKRLLDVAGAAVGLVLLSPLFLAIAATIRCSLGSPVLFRQLRPGLHGRPFTIYKFRTMRDARAPTGQPLPDAERLTALGRALRRTSLDELPELWNVLRGDMSFVGPRPLLMEYLPLYTPEQARRHDVLPGITGWAQVNGRNAISWEERFRLDLWYVEHRWLGLDCRILMRTVGRVFARSGISQNGQATMEPFRGTAAQSVFDLGWWGPR